jgi:hypothetical protein
MSGATEKIIIDFETGTAVIEPLTEEEIAANNEVIALKEAARAERAAAESAKLEAKSSARAKLAALGLTEEEISAIVG